MIRRWVVIRCPRSKLIDGLYGAPRPLLSAMF
jgi:hypothetical protein